MNLICYRISADAPDLIPARSGRAWMDAAGEGYPYRCIPLSVANATGWELICPAGFTATWNGGTAPGDLTIEQDEGAAGNPAYFAQSVFGHGVLSFHPGYLFRTDAEWALWCRGAPNSFKDGITALDALVETDWLPFNFTMSWRFTRPGSVRFEQGEPFCFILPLPHVDIESIKPRMLWLSDDPQLQAEHDAWAASRGESGNRLCERDPETTDDWQHYYYRRTSPARATLAPRTHRIERRMAEPVTAAPSADASTRSQGAEARARSSTQNIIWIASYPRSGNTWVRVFIHNLLHEFAGEADHVQDINSLQEYTVRENRLDRYAEVLGKPVAEASQAEIARARPEVQRRLAATQGTPLFVKTHLCLGNDYRYPTINLDATLAAIYIVRNPLDVVVSYAHHSSKSIDATILHMARSGLKTNADDRRAHEVLGSWSQNVASWTGMTGRPVHLMRYEDMLDGPERSFGALARFLRLAPSDEQLKRAVAKSRFAELRRQEEERGFKERPDVCQQFFRDGRAGQWREVLSQKQIEDLCRAHAPIMQRFGYLSADCGASLTPMQIISARVPAGVKGISHQSA